VIERFEEQPERNHQKLINALSSITLISVITGFGIVCSVIKVIRYSGWLEHVARVFLPEIPFLPLNEDLQ